LQGEKQRHTTVISRKRFVVAEVSLDQSGLGKRVQIKFLVGALVGPVFRHTFRVRRIADGQSPKMTICQWSIEEVTL
jgi:hypothetical protein